jgi:hypothetical protein
MAGPSGTARKRRRHTPVARGRLSGEERRRAALQVTAELGNARDAYRFNTKRRRRNTGNGEGRRGWHEKHARNNRHQQTRTIRTNRCYGADDRLRGSAQNRLPETGGHGALMLPIAAAASGQGRFGTEIEKWDEKRQQKKRKQNATDRPRTQTVRLRRITTTIFLTRHKQIAFYGAFLSSIIGNEKTCHSWSKVQNLELHYHIQVRWDSVPESCW